MINKTILVSLFLLAQSCSFKNTSSKAHNPPPSIEQINFGEVDKNKDGSISKEEVEEYNTSEKCEKINISTPILYLSILSIIILLICGYKKIHTFLRSVFVKK